MTGPVTCKENVMKNLLHTLSRMLGTRARRAAGGRTSQLVSPEPEQQDSCAAASWQMLGTLLETQARVHAMSVVEPVGSCTSVRAEALDMALRASIRAQFLALARYQEEGIMSEDLLEYLLTHAATASRQAGPQADSGNPCPHIEGTGK